MKQAILLVAVALFGLTAGEAWAATTITTTRATVDAQCGAGKSGCIRACGSTNCHYHCTGNNCTVTIYLAKKPTAGGSAGGGVKAR
jgi:hypothetical protein